MLPKHTHSHNGEPAHSSKSIYSEGLFCVQGLGDFRAVTFSPSILFSRGSLLNGLLPHCTLNPHSFLLKQLQTKAWVDYSGVFVSWQPCGWHMLMVWGEEVVICKNGTRSCWSYPRETAALSGIDVCSRKGKWKCFRREWRFSQSPHEKKGHLWFVLRVVSAEMDSFRLLLNNHTSSCPDVFNRLFNRARVE